MKIVVTKSPFDEDTDLPWTYEEDGFVRWVDEVFFEGYKLDPKEHPEITRTVEESVEHLRGLGFTVEVLQ